MTRIQVRNSGTAVHHVRHIGGRITAWVRRGPGVVVACLLLAAGTWAFIEIADEVVAGETRRFDGWVMELFWRGDLTTLEARPVGPPWLINAALDLTALGSVTVLMIVTLLVAAFLALKKNYRAMSLVLIATILGQIINGLLKSAFGRERPDAHLHLQEVSMASFPSGHAMMSAVTYLTLGALVASLESRKRTKTYALGAAVLITLLVGLTRVYLGVHYATDVLAGWAAGVTWASACWLAARWLKRHGMLREQAQ